MARTNIVLDDDLVAEGLALSGARTRRELVDRALHVYVARLKQEEIRTLRGQVTFEEGYDHRALRVDRGPNERVGP